MILLDNIKDYKLLTQSIKGISIENKELGKNQLILHIGNTEENFIEFINSNIFIPTYFKSYYKEKLIVSDNKKIRKIYNQSNHYKEILDKVNYNLICRQNISAYKNANLFYDLTPYLLANQESNKHNILIKTQEFFDGLHTKFNEFKYKYKLIVFNIDGMDPNNNTSFLYYFINAIKKKSEYILNYFNNVDFLFISPRNKTYFKFTIDENIFSNKQKINIRINNLLMSEDEIKEIIEKENNNISSNAPSSGFIDKLDSKDVIDDKEIKKENIKEKIEDEIGVSSNDDNEDISEIDKKIESTVNNDNNEDMTEEQMLELMTNDKAFKDTLIQAQQDKLNGDRKKTAEQLLIQQDKLDFNNISFKDLKENYQDKKIDHEDISDGNIKNLVNKEVLKSTLKDYDDTYMKKKFNKDIVSVLKSFNNDNDIGVYVNKINLVSNNTDMNKQQLLEVEFKDDTNVTHKFKINIPEIKDGKFMYVNGTKKVIMKQLVFMPIVKLEPDRVQITTNYNKHFVTRFGQRFSEKLSYLKTLFTKQNLIKYKKQGVTFEYKFGNSLKNNGKFTVTSEYVDISSYLFSLNIEDYILIFDQQYIQDLLDIKKPKYNEKLALKATFDKKEYFMIGYLKNKSKLILSNVIDKKIYLYDGKNYENLDITLSSWIVELVYNNTTEKVKSITSAKIKTNTKLTYSRMEINNKTLPIAILLGYELGLLNLLDRYEIEYTFETKNRSLSIQDDMGKIKFKDGYLYYDTSKIRNSMLLSGLLEMNCEEIIFAEMNEPQPYVDYFGDAFNSRNAAKGFHNSISLLIDPITKDILEELNLPTNVYDVLLYANTLLEDISFTEPNDVNNFRVRGAEQVPAMMYKVFADAFKHYKDSKHAKNPIKITVDPDILTKKLMELKTIENYSSLNPSLELERMGTASMKGLAGINVNEAYTKRVRGYNENMKNIISLNKPEGNQVGIVRQLTYDPKITNIYGFIDPSNKNGNGSTTQYDASELLNPSTTVHADAPRMSMQSVQQKHIVSVLGQTPPLIGSGIEKTAAYMISDEFAFKAKESGIVESVDEKNKVAIIKYKSGKQDLIDLDIVETNNSNGGFYNSQVFELLYKPGEKFTKGAILAKNPNFFSGDGKKDDIIYCLGRVTKVAIASADFTLEDSSIITDEVSEAMATKVTMRKTKVLDKNATVSFIAKEGQAIKTGDPLLVFENSFNDESMNDILGKIGNEFAENIAEMAKNELKCKYTGHVVKINIYYSNDLSEYSESLQKVIKSYINSKKSRKAIIEKIKGTGYDSLNAPIIEQQKENKIKGEDVIDGVMFEFFIEYYQELGIGDKIIYGTALKTIVSKVLEKGEEPFSEFRPDENVEAVLSPLSINSRMTLDIFVDGIASKALIELKRTIKDIYQSG